MRVARRRGERSRKREGEEREELEKKEKKEGAPAAGSGRICTWTRPSVEPLRPDLAGLRGGGHRGDGHDSPPLPLRKKPHQDRSVRERERERVRVRVRES